MAAIVVVSKFNILIESDDVNVMYKFQSTIQKSQASINTLSSSKTGLIYKIVNDLSYGPFFT